MIKNFKIIIICILISFLASCSQVLQSVKLEIDSKDISSQENFNVIAKTLTVKEAGAQKYAPYAREVLQSGSGNNASPIPEKLALLSEFPKFEPITEYKIGIGDVLTFTRLIENNRPPSKININWPTQQVLTNYKLGIGDTIALTLIRDDNSLNQIVPLNGVGTETNSSFQTTVNNSQQTDNTIISTGRIGSDGSVLLLEVGRLEAENKTLNEMRSEVRNILIRNGISPRFQLEIVEFKSQKAYLTVNSKSNVIILDDQKTTIKDILTSAGVGLKPGVTTRIRLQRNGDEYSVLLRDIYSKNAPKIHIQSSDHIIVEDSSANIVTSSSVVDHEGKVVFEGIGKMNAAGRLINELHIEINSLIKKVPDSQNAFQIQVTQFLSKRALLSIPGKSGISITITDTPMTLTEVLTQNGLSREGDKIFRINLQRNKGTYRFTLNDLLNPNTPNIYLKPGDQITVEILPYKENKVFILGAVSPQIFKINPTNRETLADVLFTSGGTLSASGAKRSEVYLLRGREPIIAYHLDAQSPTRLIVAEAMELRPNDILYVAEQPIISFNRTLATIVPLRILLRDIQDENIP